MAKFNQKLNTFRDHLISLNHDRIIWMYLSITVVAVSLALVYGWGKLIAFDSHILWAFISAGTIVVAVAWWYWTMSLIRKLLDIQIDVVDIIKELTTDIKDIKVEVTDFLNKN